MKKKKIHNISSYVGRRTFRVGKSMAMSNEGNFHLAAFLKRGKSLIRIGINQKVSHPRFLRVENGIEMGFLHAEMDAILSARPGDTLIVVRWKKNGDITMARPCKHCQRFIVEAGIKKVIYSGWGGNFYSERFE